jgi:hypothetical protein
MMLEFLYVAVTYYYRRNGKNENNCSVGKYLFS